MSDCVPLISTSLGNLPVDSLEYVTSWEEHEDRIRFSERWTLDGVTVKENSHNYIKKGAVAGLMGGSFS